MKCALWRSGPLVAEPCEPLGGLGAGTGSSPGTGVWWQRCRATRGRASPDIIPVTHIANFLENVSQTSVLFRQVDLNCSFKDLPFETIGNLIQVQG